MHKTFFNAKKDRERAAEREESIKREIESNKKFDRLFGLRRNNDATNEIADLAGFLLEVSYI